MKEIIKQFVCRVNTELSQTTYDYKAVVKCSFGSPYRIEVISRTYKNGRIKVYSKNEFYFYSAEEMFREYECHYSFRKNSVYTESIEILI